MAEDSKKNENIEAVDNKEAKKPRKKPSMKIVLISIISLLLILIVIGISILLFSGNSSEQTYQENSTEELKEEIEIQEESFDLSSINSKKLNDELALFTNNNLPKNNKEDLIIENENRKILEEQKRIEEESIKIEEEFLKNQKEQLLETKNELQEEMKKLEELKQEALLIKDELLKAQNSINENKEEVSRNPFENIKTTQKDDENQEIVSNSENINFVKLINVAKIKGVLYKKYLDKITSINKNTLLCRDELNRIEIYFGPFTNENLREDLLKELKKSGFSESYSIELSQGEFDKRCNY